MVVYFQCCHPGKGHRHPTVFGTFGQNKAQKFILHMYLRGFAKFGIKVA